MKTQVRLFCGVSTATGASVIHRLGARSVVVGAAAVALAAFRATPAFALPQFTLNPASLAGVTASNVVADNMVLSDFATINLTPSGPGATFAETAILPVVELQLGGSTAVATGFDTNGGYGLYYKVVAAGTVNTPTFGLGSTGTFTSATINLFEFKYGASAPVYSSAGTVTGTTGDTLVATGALLSGFISAQPDGTPTVSALSSFNPLVPAFFVSPMPFYTLDFSSFTNTPTEVTNTGSQVTISQGGGSINFIGMPEPASLGILGLGLVITGILRHRRPPI